MVTITNGMITTQVTSGAFQNLFKDMGYTIVDENKTYTDEYLDAQEGNHEMSEEEKFIADIMEKPISEWKGAEVKKFAEIKKVDISGTKNAAEAKEIIKAFMEKQ